MHPKRIPAGGYLALALLSFAAFFMFAQDAFADSPSLTVLVHVINDSGGTASAGDVGVHIAGSSRASVFDITGSETGTTFTLDRGGYAVATSTSLTGYVSSLSPDCSGFFTQDTDTATCTITEDDIPATLIVKNVVDNTNGGTATPDAFSFALNGTGTTTFDGSGETDLSVSAGTYDVAETATSTYGVAYTGCSGITLALAGTATCIITNTFAAFSSDLSLSMSADNTTPQTGDTVHYTLTVGNAGPSDASSTVVTDILPADLGYVSDDSGGAYASSTGEWTVGTLPQGSTASLVITATVLGTEGSTILNAASATSSNSDLDLTNNSANASLTVQAPPVVPPSDSGDGGGGNGPVSSGGGGGGGGGSVATALPNNGGGTASTTGTVLGATVYNFTTDFGFGATGTDVTELQKILIAEGDLKIAAPTGTFGPLTLAAVKAYQSAHGITPQSGYVGPKTRAVLNLGSTPTSADEQKAFLVQQLQNELKTLLAQIAAMSATTSSR